MCHEHKNASDMTAMRLDWTKNLKSGFQEVCKVLSGSRIFFFYCEKADTAIWLAKNICALQYVYYYCSQIKQKKLYVCIMLKFLDKMLRTNRNVDRAAEMVYNVIVNKRYNANLKKIPSFS